MKMGFAEGHLWQVEFALGESCGWRTIEDISLFLCFHPSNSVSFLFSIFIFIFLSLPICWSSWAIHRETKRETEEGLFVCLEYIYILQVGRLRYGIETEMEWGGAEKAGDKWLLFAHSHRLQLKTFFFSFFFFLFLFWQVSRRAFHGHQNTLLHLSL